MLSLSQGITRADSEEDIHTLRSIRALAYLQIKRFDGALSDLEIASSIAPLTGKSLFRKSQALHGLTRWRACAKTLKDLCIKHPNEEEVQEKLKRIINRIVEQSTGKYSFKQLYAEVEELKLPYLDHATYTGPVEVRPSSTGGRGLFTTATVKAGDLLLCEKAFACAFYDDSIERDYQITVLMTPEYKSMAIGMQTDLDQIIIQKLYRNPSLSPIITDLCHGSYDPVGVTNVDDTPVVDS